MLIVSATDGGLRKLRDELEAENSGVHIPAKIRWLGVAKAARRTTSRPTTDALSRNARWVRATRAHTGRPNARIAGGPMGRGRMPTLLRGRPACPLGDGSHHLLPAGREGPRPQRCPNMRPQSPRGRGRWARWGPRRRSSPARRAWRSRRPGGENRFEVLLIPSVIQVFSKPSLNNRTEY